MSNYELSQPKISTGSLYLWADWIELACLQDPDGAVYFQDILKEYWDFETGLGAIFFSPDEQEWSDEVIPDDENKAQYDDRKATRIHDLHKYILVRSNLLGELYPFDVDPANAYIKLKSVPTFWHEVYCFLLLASNLRVIDKDKRSGLTSDFELISTYAMRALLPAGTIIRSFGTAPHPDFPGYEGNKYRKFTQLADDLCANLNVKEENLPRTDSGDGGIDIVAWHSFNDGAPFMPLYFAQSGCTDDEAAMFKKQDEVSRTKLKDFFGFIFPANIMFTPQCYRDAKGTWPKPFEIRSFFIDRVRLLRLLEPSFTMQEARHLVSMGMVKEVLANAP